MQRIDLIDESARVLAARLATTLRDAMLCRIIVAFRDRPVTQRELGALFGLSESYVSRALRRYKEKEKEAAVQTGEQPVAEPGER